MRHFSEFQRLFLSEVFLRKSTWIKLQCYMSFDCLLSKVFAQGASINDVTCLWVQDVLRPSYLKKWQRGRLSKISNYAWRHFWTTQYRKCSFVCSRWVCDCPEPDLSSLRDSGVTKSLFTLRSGNNDSSRKCDEGSRQVPRFEYIWKTCWYRIWRWSNCELILVDFENAYIIAEKSRSQIMCQCVFSRLIPCSLFLRFWKQRHVGLSLTVLSWILGSSHTQSFEL